MNDDVERHVRQMAGLHPAKIDPAPAVFSGFVAPTDLQIEAERQRCLREALGREPTEAE